MRFYISQTKVITEVMESGDTVTVAIYDKETGAAVSLVTNTATEVGVTGIYRYVIDMTTPPAEGVTDYVYVFTGTLQTRYGEFVIEEDVLEGTDIADAVDTKLTAEHGSGSWETADISGVSSDVTDIKERTDNLPDSPAAVGSEMKLEDGAITAVKAPNLDVAVSTRASETNATANKNEIVGSILNLDVDYTFPSVVHVDAVDGVDPEISYTDSSLRVNMGDAEVVGDDPLVVVIIIREGEVVAAIIPTVNVGTPGFERRLAVGFTVNLANFEPEILMEGDLIATVIGNFSFEVGGITYNVPQQRWIASVLKEPSDVSDLATEANATANRNDVIAAIPTDYALEATLDAAETSIIAAVDGVGAVAGDIKEKTDNLPADPTSETVATANKDEIISEIETAEVDLDPVIDAIGDVSGLITDVKEKTDNLPADPTSETAATTNKNEIIAAIPDDYALEATLAATEALLSGEIGDVHGLVGDIKEKTDNLPVDPASESQATANKDEIISSVETAEVDLTPVIEKVDAVAESMTRALGLLHENVRVVNTFDGGKHTGSVVKIYDSKEHAEQEEPAGLVGTYNLVVQYNDDDQPESYLMVKE